MLSNRCPWCGEEAKENTNDVLVKITTGRGERKIHLLCLSEFEEIIKPRMMLNLSCEDCGK